MNSKLTDPDTSLFRQLQTGKIDETSWREFQGRIRRWICHNYPSLYAEADELAGEAAVCAFESIHSFRGEARFIRWAHRIAHHVVSKHLNRQAGAVVLSFEDMHEEVVADDAIGKQMMQLAAEAAMQTLTDQERTVFLSRVRHDVGHKEIARRLAISPNASRQTWMRAAEKIGRYRRDNQW